MALSCAVSRSEPGAPPGSGRLRSVVCVCACLASGCSQNDPCMLRTASVTTRLNAARKAASLRAATALIASVVTADHGLRLAERAAYNVRETLDQGLGSSPSEWRSVYPRSPPKLM